MRPRVWLGAVLLAPTFALAAGDGMILLQRAAVAAERLNFEGTFVYRSGARSETSRIAHTVSGGREMERVEVLDGSPREVIREGGDVKCFLPDEKLLIVEKGARARSFPALLPRGLGSLGDHYMARRAGQERVAGLEAQRVRLDPRDVFRYAHEFWIEPGSGLLLRAGLIDDRGEILENLGFTQVRIGDDIDPSRLKPRFAGDRNLRVQQVRTREVRPEDEGWAFRQSLPGFRRVAAMRREAQGSAPESLHVVYSDGLAAISVFIERLGEASDGIENGLASMGPLSVYRRQADGHRLLVMGEVPAAAVKRLGDGIERKRR